MLKIKQHGNDRLDLVLSGKVDEKIMTAGLDEFMEKSEGVEHGKILYEIYDFEFPTLAAINVKLSRLPSLFGVIKKFDRMAIVTEKTWLRYASEVEGALIPGLEIKAFEREDKDKAEAWLTH
ncbi:MAG: STAS/SEC14 domain-containing protein [Campylobacterota bacterium]|nr:STAS/SEC14 domain-containing protein [Campylobacterota bacterium]